MKECQLHNDHKKSSASKSKLYPTVSVQDTSVVQEELRTSGSLAIWVQDDVYKIETEAHDANF